MKRSFSFLSCALLLAGCGSSVDTSTFDDAGASETGPGGDASPQDGQSDDAGPCKPGSVDNGACGACGTHVRVCDSGGTWSDWSACSGETGECTPGATRSTACGGNCGVQTDTCSSTCSWSAGTTCTQGACSPGSTDSSSDGCSNGAEKSRTCSDQCAWGAYGACVAVSCTPGAVDNRSCGKCGSQLRVCNSTTSTWSDWSVCSGETGVCVPGDSEKVACGGCGLGTSTATCDSTCNWSAPGACSGEVCEPGQTDSTTSGCTGGSVRTRSCSSSSCTWGPYGSCGSPQPTGWRVMAAAPILGRARHAAVWTGKEMLVWGGTAYAQTTVTAFADGAAYDPVGNTWRMLPAVPSSFVARDSMSAVWTGSKMMVWGGSNGSTTANAYYNDGAIYDPATNAWTTIPAAPIAARENGAAGAIGVWSTTTNELLVWGGDGPLDITGTSASYYGDGAAFNPTTKAWRVLSATGAPAARSDQATIWTGSKMLVWGGDAVTVTIFGTATSFNDGGSYDPATNVWSTLAATSLGARTFMTVAAGSSALVMFGGDDAATGADYADGAIYDDATHAWSALPTVTTIANPARERASSWWANNQLYVFGGYDDAVGTALATGMIYSPTTGTWTAMPSTNAPTARARASVVWTGQDAIVWGGSIDFNSALGDGRVYRP